MILFGSFLSLFLLWEESMLLFYVRIDGLLAVAISLHMVRSRYKQVAQVLLSILAKIAIYCC